MDTNDKSVNLDGHTVSEVLLETPFFSVVLENNYYTIHEKNVKSGVVVVGVLGNEFVLGKYLRKAVGAVMTEFPRGSLDANETSEDAALRELLEETGYVGANPRVIGNFFSNTSLIRSSVDVVVVDIVGKAREVGDGEACEVFLADKSLISEMLKSGEISDAHTMAAWGLLP